MRITAPVCKLCRREGTKLFLKGDRCQSARCAIEKNRPPTSGRSRYSSRDSTYRVQLREKEKVRVFYGVMERQFRRYFSMAEKSGAAPGEKLLVMLESRLDNVLCLSGLVVGRRTARQLIYGGHIRVNGRRLDAPSYLVKPGDKVGFRPGSKALPRLKEALAARKGEAPTVPSWLTVDRAGMTMEIVREPVRGEVTLPIEEGHIVNLYSR